MRSASHCTPPGQGAGLVGCGQWSARRGIGRCRGVPAVREPVSFAGGQGTMRCLGCRGREKLFAIFRAVGQIDHFFMWGAGFGDRESIISDDAITVSSTGGCFPGFASTSVGGRVRPGPAASCQGGCRGCSAVPSGRQQGVCPAGQAASCQPGTWVTGTPWARNMSTMAGSSSYAWITS